MDKFDFWALILIIVGLWLVVIVAFTFKDAGRLEICNEMHWKSEACVAEWSKRVSDAGIENFEGGVK
jgi:hypothetical protein